MRSFAALALTLLFSSSARAEGHTTGIRCGGNNTAFPGPGWGNYGILFKSSLSYGFLLNQSKSVTQVCLHSGPMVAYALGMDEAGPKALRILPIATHTSHEGGYMAAAVVVNAPDVETAKRLNKAVKLPNSTLYRNPGQLVSSLAAQIDANESIIVVPPDGSDVQSLGIMITASKPAILSAGAAAAWAIAGWYTLFS